MNYYDAARVRKTGLGNLMADKLVSGQGIGTAIGGAITQKFKAKLIGIKEKFDPLNIAKFLFFGSKLGTTLFGKATGRSTADINYFTGRKEPRRYRRGVDSVSDALQPPPILPRPAGSAKTKRLLKSVLLFMQKTRAEELEYQETKQTFDELNSKMEEDRHNEVIDVLVEATKAKVKAEKEMKKQTEKREKELKRREKEIERQKKELLKDQKKSEVTKPAETPKPETEAATRVGEKVGAVARATATAARAGAPLIAAGAGVSIIGEEIAKGESARGSYNAANKGTRDNKIIAVQEKLNLEEMTIEEIMRRQAIKWGSPNEKEKLFAVGKYQIIPDTLKDAVKKLKISEKEKFSGQLQEKIFAEYLIGSRRPAITKYLNNPVDDPKLLHDAVKQLSLEWASIADPDIPGGKTSHYGSGNKASMTVEQANEYLRKDRERIQSKSKATPVPNNTDVAQKVEGGSKQVAEMKKEMQQQAQAPVVVMQHTNQLLQQRAVNLPAKSADINPVVK